MSVDIDRTMGGRATIRDVLFDAERRLAAVGVPSPSVDAAEIVAFAMGTTRGRLILQDPIGSDERVQIERLLTKRLSRVPLQHLIGTVGFRYLEVSVGMGVFIPRPETELVAEAAIRELKLQPDGHRIGVDLCAGSGAIAISLATEAPGSVIHAVELSDDAIVWTRRNVARHEQLIGDAASRVEVLHDDSCAAADPGHGLSSLAGQVAVVVSNPPYVPSGMVPREPEVRDHEPKIALYGGEDGLDIVRGVLRTAAILLRPGGLLVIEHSDMQGVEAGPKGVPGAAREMTTDDELATMTSILPGRPVWTKVADRTDLAGRPRFTVARRVE